MPELPGHERREERREKRKERRERRRVRFGDYFTSDELDDGDVDLEEVEPGEQIPEEEQVEPWAEGDKVLLPVLRERLVKYRDFLREYREAHPEEEEVSSGSD